jgi:hypothetical protein
VSPSRATSPSRALPPRLRRRSKQRLHKVPTLSFGIALGTGWAKKAYSPIFLERSQEV